MSRPIRILNLMEEFLPYGGGELFLRDLIKNTPKDRVDFIATVSCGRMNGEIGFPEPIIPLEQYVDMKPDVLLYHGMVGPFMEKFMNIPIRIMMAHSDYLVDHYMRRDSPYATHVIAVSQKVKNSITFEPCCVINPGIDFKNYQVLADRKSTRQSLGFQENDIVVGQFGRITDLKNVEMIVEAIGCLKENVKLLLIGNGPNLANVVRFAEELIPSRFNCLRYVDSRWIGTYYQAIDIFCHGSFGEGNPRVMWESLYYEKPFIGMAVGSIPDVIIPGVTGYIVSNAKNMAWAIKQASLKSANKGLMKKTAIEQGSIEKTVREFVDYIEGVV